MSILAVEILKIGNYILNLADLIIIVGLIFSILANILQWRHQRKQTSWKIEYANKNILNLLKPPINEKAIPPLNVIISLIGCTSDDLKIKKSKLYSVETFYNFIIKEIMDNQNLNSIEKNELIKLVEKQKETIPTKRHFPAAWIYKLLHYSYTKLGSIEKKVKPIIKPKEKKEKILLFYDDFEKFQGWDNYEEGKISQSKDFSHAGKFSLKKDLKVDFHVVYKKLENKIILSDKYYILFSGWIYRHFIPSPNVGDRLAIEDSNFSGYGFCINHGNNKIWIERRDNGKPTVISTICDCYVAKNKWYYFEFFMKEASFMLRVWKEGEEIKGIIEELDSFIDMSYSSFDRIAVHGGFPYYVDDIKIEKFIY